MTKTPRYEAETYAKGRHGFAVVLDHETRDNAAAFVGPEAGEQAECFAAKMNEEAGR